MAAAAVAAPPWGPGGNSRTLPQWMDTKGNHGELVVLSMVPKEGSKFPDNPFIIGRSLEQAIGGRLDDTYTENRGAKYVLKVRSEAKAKKLLAIKELIDGTQVEIQLHSSLNFRKCVVSCPEAINMDKKLLETELKSQKVTDAYRFTRKEGNVVVNTPTLLLTISGTVIPKYIYFGSLRVPTRLHYPSPMMCYKCYDYGHTKLRCKGQERCRNCSQNHEIIPNVACTKPAKCLHCGEAHPSISKKCKVYQKEEEIVRIKVNNDMTFADAKKEYDRAHGVTSFAGISGAQSRLQEDAKDREIQLLRTEISRMKGVDQELAKLRKLVEELSARRHRRSEHKKKLTLIPNDSEMDGEETDKVDTGTKRKQLTGSGETSPPHKKTVNEDDNDSEMMCASNYNTTGANGGELSSLLPNKSQ